jgi:hypothetical protein
MSGYPSFSSISLVPKDYLTHRKKTRASLEILGTLLAANGRHFRPDVIMQT